MEIDIFIMTNTFLDQANRIVDEEILKMHQAQLDGEDVETNDEKQIEYNIWYKPNEYYDFGAQIEYEAIVDEEIKELNDLGRFFYYCKFETYKNNYQDRLNKFIKDYEDAEAIFFIKKELQVYSKPIQNIGAFQRLNTSQIKKLKYTGQKTIWFLIEEAKGLGFNIDFENEEIKISQIIEIKKDLPRNKENFTWFKVGKLFAQGIPQNLYKKLESFPKVARKLNFKTSDKTYFSETYNNTTTRDKNIY